MNLVIIKLYKAVFLYMSSGGYRSRHPESAPRRGRRVRGSAEQRFSSNPSLISMANMALGTGASVRTVSDHVYNMGKISILSYLFSDIHLLIEVKWCNCMNFLFLFAGEDQVYKNSIKKH